jgi:hypothetical protein
LGGLSMIGENTPNKYSANRRINAAKVDPNASSSVNLH